MSGWIAGATLVAGIGGAALNAAGTSAAQSSQNKALAQNAASTNAANFFQGLAARGTNVQQIIKNDPRGSNFWPQQYAAAQAKGDKRDFDTWFVSAINASKSDPIWDLIANPAGTSGAANTTLPAWAVDANGKQIQPELYNQLVAQANGAANPAKAPVKNIATVENVAALFAANPTLRQGIVDNMAGSDDTRSPEQWLVDHITQTESQSGGGAYTTNLRNFLSAQAAGRDTHVVGDDGITPNANATAATSTGTAAGAPGVGNNTTLDPRISALIGQSTGAAAKIFDDTYLKQTQDALDPIAKARAAEAAAQLAKINEQRGLSGDLKNTELAGISDVLAARTAGAGGIYNASLASAGGVRDAGTAAANDIYDTNVAKLAQVLGVRLDAAKQIYDASMTSAGGVRDARNTGAAAIYDATKTGAKDIYGAELGRADTYAQSAQDALGRILAQNTADRARQGFTGGSSGSDIVKARLMADYTQRGAGARADAGVNYQGRLSDAGIGYQTRLSDSGVGYATDTGKAGIGLATTSGQSREQDAIAQLNAAVERAKGLGLINTNFATQTGQAGVTQAGTLASAGEQNAIANLQAQADDARRRLTYLTSDADIAKANADLQNAQDQLTAITQNQNRQTGAVTLPYQLAGLDLATKNNLNSQQYSDWDELMKRLSSFNVGTAPTTVPTATANPGAVLNGANIGGAAISAGATAAGNYLSNQQLIQLINASKAPPATTTPSTPKNSPFGDSVFTNPNG